MFSKNNNLWLVLILGVVFFAFRGILETFYQQDEWQGYGIFLVSGFKFVFVSVNSVLGFLLGEGRIANNFILYIFYKFFPLNILPFAIFVLFMHLLNTWLVFNLAKRLFLKSLPALIGSLFFALNSVSQNAVLWPATSIGTLSATILILLTVFAFLEFIKTNNYKYNLISFVLIYFSMFFKEHGVFMFLYLPIGYLLYKKIKLADFLKFFWIYFVFLLIVGYYRLTELAMIAGNETLFLSSTTSSYWQVLVTRAFLYPLTSFSLTFLPAQPTWWFARSITNFYYPFIGGDQFILVAQTVVLDLIATVGTFLIFAYLSFLFTFTKKVEYKNVVFVVGFMWCSFLPYIVISKNYAYLESRYYYLAALAGGLLISFVLGKMLELFKDRYLKISLIFMSFMFIYWHYGFLQKEIGQQIVLANSRKQIVSVLKSSAFDLKEKNVLLINSDEDYYALGNKLPLQQGTGYTLMTLFYSSGKIPKELVLDNFLYEIGSQGYKEVNGLGFGYFYEEKEIKNLGVNTNVIKYDFDGEKLIRR